MRYDLLQGNVTVDDLISVSPYNDTVYKVSERRLGLDVLLMSEILNQDDNSCVSDLPAFAISGAIDPEKYYDLYTEYFSVPDITEALENVLRATASGGFTYAYPRKSSDSHGDNLQRAQR